MGTQILRNRLIALWLGTFLRPVLILLPAFLLLTGAARASGPARTMLSLGVFFQLVIGLMILPKRSSWHFTLGPAVVTLYLVGLSWIGIATKDSGDWYSHLCQALLLLVPLFVIGGDVLAYGGSHARRHSQALAHALAQRRDWPADLFACRDLPEVKALREAFHADAAPALALLQHPLLPVRVAALAALEFHENWLPGQAEHILRVGLQSPVPAVRAAAASALAQADGRCIIEPLAELLQDPAPVVRRAASEALLWNSETRWSWIRSAVRGSLADPAHGMDGPLPCDGRMLTREVIADLHAWTAEKGILGIRAAQTLGVHFGRLLQENPEQPVVEYLIRLLTDPHGPPPLRVEIGQLLQSRGIWDDSLPDLLLGAANPAPLRLMAVEAVLAEGRNDAALRALYEIARLPNREIALATAEVAQRLLGVDLGIVPGEPLPPLNSRKAAEITRRVMSWAAEEQDRLTATDPDIMIKGTI